MRVRFLVLLPGWNSRKYSANEDVPLSLRTSRPTILTPELHPPDPPIATRKPSKRVSTRKSGDCWPTSNAIAAIVDRATHLQRRL
jgi:hypothetical protein